MKTDSQLQADVQAELKWDPSISECEIGAKVKDGVVTLSGQVDSFSRKSNAGCAARRVAGVKAVTDEIGVALPRSSYRGDGDISRTAEIALEWLAAMPQGKIKPKVENGWVTLSGEVPWGYQRQAAECAMHSLLGVTGVTNNIGIKAQSSAVAVKEDIEAALKRRAQKDAKQIGVDVKGSDVTLSGTIHSWSERDLANQAAWAAPGVRNVVNNISVAA